MIFSPAAVARAFTTACSSPRLGLFPPLRSRMGRTSARCGTSPRLCGRRFPLSARRALPDAAGFGSSLPPARADGAAKAHAVRPAASASSALFRRSVRLEWVAVLALLEPYALLHPRMLPAALVRLAFLPMTAFCAANAFFAHRLARSPASARPLSQGRANPGRLRGLRRGAAPRRVSQPARACAAAFVSLLWLAAPPVPRAESPGNRTHPAQRSRTRGFCASRGKRLPPRRSCRPGAAMLVACGGCMLGFLEPDEAARQMLSLLPDLVCAA